MEQIKFEKQFNIILVFAIILTIFTFVITLFYDVEKINNVLYYIDLLVTIVFFIDLYLLHKKSPNWKYFFAHYWIDIIATIPFITLFRIAKLFRGFKLIKILTKSTKLSKIPEVIKIKSRFLRLGKTLSKKEKVKK